MVAPPRSPWINSCVGFHNRKAFLLMLFYGCLCAFVAILATLCRAQALFAQLPLARLVLLCAAFAFAVLVLLVIGNFLRFHLTLVLRNYTTIETLDVKRQNKDFEDIASQYDIGAYYNWVQVFGRNAATWLIPPFCCGQGPAGDGILWPKLH